MFVGDVKNAIRAEQTQYLGHPAASLHLGHPAAYACNISIAYSLKKSISLTILPDYSYHFRALSHIDFRKCFWYQPNTA